jgi:hypothetical protein
MVSAGGGSLGVDGADELSAALGDGGSAQEKASTAQGKTQRDFSIAS